MKRSSRRGRLIWIPATAALVLLLASCTRETKAAPTRQEVAIDPNVFETDHPELFRTTKVESRQMPTVLTANGTITPDVNRTIHVTSLGGGRVAELKVKLGDAVQKGQTLLIISSPDLASAFSDYQKAVADEQLSKRALDRAQLLYDKGAIAEKDLQTAQDAEQKALVDVRTTEQRVRVLGGDPAHPTSMIDLRAPITGTIV